MDCQTVSCTSNGSLNHDHVLVQNIHVQSIFVAAEVFCAHNLVITRITAAFRGQKTLGHYSFEALALPNKLLTQLHIIVGHSHLAFHPSVFKSHQVGATHALPNLVLALNCLL